MSYTYDTQRNVTSVTDSYGTTSYTYDTNGHLTSTTDPLTHEWSTTYSGDNVTSVSDPLSSVSIYYGDTYQPNVPTSVLDAVAQTWSATHNAYGQNTTQTPPTGSETGTVTTTYDETSGSATLGYAKSVTDGNGNLATMDSYDSLGDLTSISTYPINGNTTTKHTTTLAYDAAQRLTLVTNPDSTTEQSVYVGQVLNHTIDEAGTQFNYSYCACGLLDGITGPLSWSLGYAHNADHQLTGFTDARGHTTSYTYGNAGELTTVTYPDSSALSFKYDSADNLAQEIDSRTLQTNYSYDAAERLTEVAYPSSYWSTTPDTYTYYNDGTVHVATDAVGTTTYTYYGNKLVESVVYNFSTAGTGNYVVSPTGLSAAQELDYTYYPDGLVDTLTWKSGTTTIASWTYAYDAGGRLTSVANGYSETTSYTYDGENKLKTQTNQNGTTTTYAYNESRGWPTSITDAASGTTFASYALTYDGGSNTVGNLTGVTEHDSSTASYAYDTLYRLTSEARTGTDATSGSYVYDLAGNLNRSADSTALVYDSANKLTNYNPSGGTAVTYAYDADGNMTFGAYTTNYWTWASNWTEGNKLTDLELNTTLTGTNPIGQDNGYGASGLREWAQPWTYSTSYTAGATHYFIYAGSILIGEVNSDGTPIAAYTWGAAGLVSEHRYDTGTAKSLWYHYGPQGETRQLTNASGAVVDNYVYGAYGNLLSSPSLAADQNPFQFGGSVGYYTDANAGSLILCGQRWYAPQYARWLSRDPAGYDGGANLYAYCGGNPVGGVDADGTDPRGVKINILKLPVVNGVKSSKIGSPVSKVTAIEVRKNGGNILVRANNQATARRVAGQIERSVPGRTLEHEAHIAPDNPRALPHCQTEGVRGHTFFNGGAASKLGKAVGLVGEVLEGIGEGLSAIPDVVILTDPSKLAYGPHGPPKL